MLACEGNGDGDFGDRKPFQYDRLQTPNARAALSSVRQGARGDVKRAIMFYDGRSETYV
jgi:hypothetical protein